MTKLFRPAVELLSSVGMLRLIVVAWMLNIWGSIGYLAPGPDDAAFISQAMGFIFHGDLGTMYFERFQLFFLNFPGYAFLQAIFYTAWNAVGLPLNIFTYKIFHLGAISLLLVFSIRLISSLSAFDRPTAIFRSNVFMLVLAISPFVIDGLYPRPEPLGLLFVVFGLSLFQAAHNKPNWADRYFVLSSICFGVAMTMHPTFVVVAGGLCGYAGYHLARSGRIGMLATCVVGAAIPLSLVVLWLWWHAPESFDVLSEHIRQRSKNTGDVGEGLNMMVRFAMFQHPSSVAVKIYYGICYLSMVVAVFWLFVSVVRRYVTRQAGGISAPHFMAQVFGLAAFANVAISSTPRVQLFTVLGFAAVFAFSSLVMVPERLRRNEPL